MSLTVNVLTPSGKGSLIGVPEVTVELVGKMKVKTDKRGRAVIAKLDPGVYDLKVREEGEHPKWAPWYDERETEFWYHKHVEAMKKVGRSVSGDAVTGAGVAGVQVKAGENSVDVWLLDRSTAMANAAAAARELATLQLKHSLTLGCGAIAEKIYVAAATARDARAKVEDSRTRYAAAGGSLNSVAELAQMLRGSDVVHAAYYRELERRCREASKKIYDVVGSPKYYALIDAYKGADAGSQMLSRRMGEWRLAVGLLKGHIDSKHNREVIRQAMALREDMPFYREDSQLLLYHWRQHKKKSSPEAVDARLLLDTAMHFGLTELLNAPFEGPAVDGLFNGAAEEVREGFEKFIAVGSVAAGPAVNVVGNLAGPPSLWVVVAQQRALKMVQAAARGASPEAAVKQLIEELNQRLPPAARLSADEVKAMATGLQSNDKLVLRAKHERFHAWVGDNVHATAAHHGVMTVLQLILAASAFYKISSVGQQVHEGGANDIAAEYVSIAVPLMNAGLASAGGVASTVAALSATRSKVITEFLKGLIPRFGALSSLGAIGGFYVSIIAVARLPDHSSALDRVFAWVDLASTGLGAAGVVVALFSGVVAAKFFAAGAVIGVVGAGVKMAIEASYTGVTKVILRRVNNVGQDPMLAYLVSDLPADCKAIMDIDIANRLQFGKSFRPSNIERDRLKNELMFDEKDEVAVMVVS